MRLFGSVNGNIDNLDRAGWLTPPFHKNLNQPESERLFYVLEEPRQFSVAIETRTWSVPVETRQPEVQ